MSSSKKHVVVVGGGGYGATIARALSAKLDKNKHDLTLVTTREFLFHLPAGLRMIVTSNGKLEERALIPYDKIFDKGPGTVKVGTVSSISKNTDGKSGNVVLESGEQISWDVLVLTPGNTWEGGIKLPSTKSEAFKFIEEWRTKFQKADKIVLAGGGAVGIELAGELRDIYDKKSITIVQAGEYLLNDTYPVKFRKDIERRLAKRNIKVIVSSHIDTIPEPGSGHVETREGKQIEADLVVPTRGGVPNTAFVESLGGSPRTDTGHLKVKPTFQLASETNILTAGDAADLKEQHQLGKAGGHVEVVVDNVVSLVNGGQATKTYKGALEGIFVTNGVNGGAAYIKALWGLSFGDRVVSMVKGKGLFIDMYRKSVGITN